MRETFASLEQETLDGLLHSLGDAVCITDENLKFFSANLNFARFYGMNSPGELLGKNTRDLYPGFERSVFYEACAITIATGETTARVGYSNNVKAWIAIRCYKIREHRYAMIVQRLVGNAIAQPGYMGQHDELTALPNRWAFEQDLERIGALRHPLTLSLFNISHFKHFNQTHGSAAGDKALMELGAALRAHADPAERVYRLQGDCFAVLSTRDEPVPEARPQAWVAALVALREWGGVPVALTFRVGVAHEEAGAPHAHILGRAEAALAHAKARKIDVVRYRPDLEGSAYDHLLTQDIQGALSAKDQWELYFQPQVDMIDRRGCGAEVLVRWNHPTRGLVPPYEFLPCAEDAGLMKAIDEAVVVKTFDVLADWTQRGRPLSLSINLSAQSLGDHRIVEVFAQQLARTGVDVRWIGVEITESSLIHDIETSQAVVEALKALGLQVSLDDFGSGYSSMAYLLRYPSHTLKIDREFTRGITQSEANRVVVNNMIGLAHGLGIAVVAEGAETEEEVDLLASFGCDMIQGYVYAQPMPQAAFEVWWDAHGHGSLASSLR